MQFCRLLRFKHTNSSRCFFNKTFAEAKTISTGLFGNPELKTPADFKKLNENVRKNCSCIVREIMSGSENKTTVQLLDDLSNEICKAADLTECIRQLHSDPKFTAAAEESARDFCQLVESLNTYTELYEKLNQSKNQEINRLSDVDKRTLDLFLDDFQQSGVHLPQNKREKFVQLSEEIFDAGARYQWGCDHEVEVTRSDKKKYGLHSTKLFSPVVDTFNNEVRKFVYTSFYQHNKNQENSLRTLVSKRHELAQLTGFETFSHRAQHNTLMGSYDNAKKFLWGIIEACRHSAEKEITVLLDVLGQCEPGHQRVAEWDIGFLSRIYKERAFGRSHHEAVTKYLKLGNVLRSFDNLIEKLYGIRFEQQNSEKGELWHSSVLKFAATDSSTGRLLGQIYMDIERRSTKAVGDCHYTVRCSKEMANGDWQTPIVVLSLSLTDGGVSDWRQIGLSSYSAENLFHELGHAMHSMLGRTKYQHVAGTRCPQDFSEIPSNLMEYFFNDVNVMQTVLRDNDGTGISLEHAATLISSRFAFTSIETVQQALYALFDLELHGPEAQNVSRGLITTTELFHSISAKALPLLVRDPNTAFQHRFHHLIQYGGKYYAYLVARSSANLIWNSVFKADPFNRQNGLKWAEVQSHGGGFPPNVLLKSILGYSPTPSHLINALKEEAANVSCLGAVNI